MRVLKDVALRAFFFWIDSIEILIEEIAAESKPWPAHPDEDLRIARLFPGGL